MQYGREVRERERERERERGFCGMPAKKMILSPSAQTPHCILYTLHNYGFTDHHKNQIHDIHSHS